MVSQVKQLFRYRSILSSWQQQPLQALIITKPTQLLEAKRLHAKRYLYWGYINEQDISQDGTMTATADPYDSSSTYFAIVDTSRVHSPIVAIARQIGMSDSILTHKHLPTVAHVNLSDSMLKSIESHGIQECVEISAVVKDTGVSPLAPLMLYRAMWHYSLTKGHKLWVMGIDNVVYDSLKTVFGRSLQKIGDQTHYMGSMVTPVSLDVESTVDVFIKDIASKRFMALLWQRRLALFLCDGLPTNALRPEHISALKQSGHYDHFVMKETT